jgi:hypothetical protein
MKTTITLLAALLLSGVVTAQIKTRNASDLDKMDGKLYTYKGVTTMRYIHSAEETSLTDNRKHVLTEEEIYNLTAVLTDAIESAGYEIQLIDGVKSVDADEIIESIDNGGSVYIVLKSGATRISMLADKTDGFVEIK